MRFTLIGVIERVRVYLTIPCSSHMGRGDMIRNGAQIVGNPHDWDGLQYDLFDVRSELRSHRFRAGVVVQTSPAATSFSSVKR